MEEQQFKDSVQALPKTFKLLKNTAWKIFTKFDKLPLKSYYDVFGKWGLRYGQFFLVAKERPMDTNVVSVHEEAILEARKYHIGIVMWLQSAKKFYWFDPEEIDKAGSTNFRGGIAFKNFLLDRARELDW